MPIDRVRLVTDFDAFYSAFQEKFRGPYDDVRRCLHAYLPEIERAGAGSTNGAILDLGCGRGEWLDLLSERNLSAEGVDTHPRLSEQAQSRRVTVHSGDALEYVREAAEATYGAITAFHLIEHLEWRPQLELLDQAYRVLRPNGIIIVEWPNIEDIRVAMQYFWLDPTHVRPVPPQLLRFMAEFVGYTDVRLRRFRPNPGLTPAPSRHLGVLPTGALGQSVADLNRCWNEFLTPGADIALFGRKSADASPRRSDP